MAGFLIPILLAALVAGGVSLQSPEHSKRLSPLPAQQSQVFDRQPKIALLVGIGSYPDASGFGKLRYPARDVAALAGELNQQGYAVRTLTDSEATRGVIRKTLKDLGEASDREQGTLLFYFSGHGYEQQGANYLAVYGSVSDDLKGEGLALTEVFDILEKTRVKRKVLLIDACRNNPLTGRQVSDNRSFKDFSQGEGLRILYSTRPGGLSFENDEFQQGVFTYYVLLGLQGNAAGSDGFVTFHDLAEYVTESVRTSGIRKGQPQVPFEAGESSGDFMLARAARPSGAASTGATAEAYLASAEASAKEGLQFVSQGRYREATVAFSKAMSVRPGVAEEYYYRGIAYGHLQEYSLAVSDFTRALELGGDVATVFGNRGYAYAEAKQYENALRDFDRAIELKPDFAAAYVGRGRAYAALSRPKPANEDFSKAIDLQPNLAAAYRERAKLLMSMQEFPRAVDDLTVLIRLSPKDPASYADRGYAYAALGQYPLAIRDCDRAVELEPGRAEAFNNRGYSYAGLGDHRRAIADYSQAIRLKPDYATAYENRARARKATGDLAGSKADSEKASALTRKPNVSRFLAEEAKVFAA